MARKAGFGRCVVHLVYIFLASACPVVASSAFSSEIDTAVGGEQEQQKGSFEQAAIMRVQNLATAVVLPLAAKAVNVVVSNDDGWVGYTTFPRQAFTTSVGRG